MYNIKFLKINFIFFVFLSIEIKPKNNNYVRYLIKICIFNLLLTFNKN